MNDRRQVDLPNLQPQVAAGDSRHIQQIFEKLLLSLGAAVNGGHGFIQVLGIVGFVVEQGL